MSDDLPFVPKELVEYLEAIYTPDFLLSTHNMDSNDELVGYMKGTTDLIATLKGLADRKEG